MSVNKPELAIVMPYCGEFPHLSYTIQSLLTELEGFVDFEIVLVDNSDTLTGFAKDSRYRATDTLNCMLKSQDTPWLMQLEYTDKLSHWSCKNLAIRNTEASFLFFVDAHCLIHPGTVRGMFEFYQKNYHWLNGSLHLPISDFFKPDAKEYQLLYESEIGLLHYQNRKPAYKLEPTFVFDTAVEIGVVKRPCMSTCGMMCRREHITDDIAFWPEELGPYGGGENYYNFTMARLGKQVHIFPVQPLRHWHVPGMWSRDYRPTYPEWAENIMIATYLVGGLSFLERLAAQNERLPQMHPVRMIKRHEAREIEERVLENSSLWERRQDIEARAVITIEEWAEQWTQ